MFGSSYADAREKKTGDGAARFARIVVSKALAMEARDRLIKNSLFISDHGEKLAVLFRISISTSSLDSCGENERMGCGTLKAAAAAIADNFCVLSRESPSV